MNGDDSRVNRKNCLSESRRAVAKNAATLTPQSFDGNKSHKNHVMRQNDDHVVSDDEDEDAFCENLGAGKSGPR